MTEIELYNTKTRSKEVFVPIHLDDVRMYVCGPTVYDRAHIGNARPVVVFDTLFRLLRHVYGHYAVSYVRNFTDVDDKINAKAAETGRPIRDITDETIKWYREDMDALGALRPTDEPRATEYIPEMVEMIEKLIASGNAYESAGHVLFDVNSYDAYGTLSGRKLDDMRAGARVEVANYKRDPMDFVLWKPSSKDLPGWDSPWGRGRPGWHIECSAMSLGLLGAEFDIHGGGLDLQFPHHENEIAQSCCANPDAGFANVWMHNEMLQVDGKKMSKSTGNYYTVRELIEEYEERFAIENIGPAIRLRFLQTHYRSTVDASRSYIEDAANKLGGWWFWTQNHINASVENFDRSELLIDSPVIAAVADDLNTPLAVAEIDKMVNELRRPPANSTIIDDYANRQIALAKKIVSAIEFLGFDFEALERLHGSYWSDRLKGRNSHNELIAKLIELRDNARSDKNFARADEIRDALNAAGIQLKDSASGVSWELSPEFDAAKLEALK
ncbi:MAG: cysteine--tRNA ligase [Paracoccaceae bacterium]